MKKYEPWTYQPSDPISPPDDGSQSTDRCSAQSSNRPARSWVSKPVPTRSPAKTLFWKPESTAATLVSSDEKTLPPRDQVMDFVCRSTPETRAVERKESSSLKLLLAPLPLKTPAA